jgi:tRNA pseudouridine38-40 synthase
MAHWKLTLSYDGGAFYGWQVQPDGLPTVQGTLAAALGRMTGENVVPQGSGRTDAGVHALAQVASVTLQASLPAENLHRALNHALPASIRVLAVEEVPAIFHARHSARGKTYEYRMFERRASVGTDQPAPENICSPFIAPYAWDCRWPVSLEAMQEAAGLIVGTHDFSSFAASDPEKGVREAGRSASGPKPVKTILSSNWERQGELLVYRVRGSGFLHHMVRNLVGTFVDIGRGALAVDDLPRILAARDRTAAGPTAPANGLFLVKVEYDEPQATMEQA